MVISNPCLVILIPDRTPGRRLTAGMTLSPLICELESKAVTQQLPDLNVFGNRPAVGISA